MKAKAKTIRNAVANHRAGMTHADARQWREGIMKFTQQEAADALGRHRSNIAKYESGELPIPKTVRLAMAALALGLRDYTVPK